jgi:eukaryotic-like serine/threonine-protein kinase
LASLGRIGKFELLRSLAVGGMAEVFLARQTGVQGFEKMLVIKKILPHLANQDRFVQMFLDEARLAARFNHPNVVQIYDLGQDRDVFYIAMEYIHGEDIKSVVRRCAKRKQRLPLEHIVKIFSGVLDGLHYAHNQTDLDGQAKGIVHRDVSPHNILVSFQGGVKLVDFGIAKARSEISTTIPGRVKGKHAYMSPEQCQGFELDLRSDIFSAGVVMYELLTWTRLFKRKTDLDTLKAVVSGEIRRPSSICPEIDEDLEAIIFKALARDREQRYQTAQEMQMALEDYLLTKGLKSNSVLVSRFMEELFADKLEARTKALEQAKAKNLEGAVLSAGDEGPDLVAFLNMFFDDSATSSDSSSGSHPGGGIDMNVGPEFTPSSDYTPAHIPAPEQAPAPVRRATTAPALEQQTANSPSKPPPPKAPPGMELLHSAPAPAPNESPIREVPAVDGSSPTRPAQPAAPALPVSQPPPPGDILDPGTFPAPQPADPTFPDPVDPMAGERLPGDPDPYAEELMPTGKKGKGFLVLVFLVLMALAGGLIYMFRDTEKKSVAPETGRVLVESVPSGGDVYFNDSRLPSQTPTEIGRIEPNVEHVVRVTLPGLPPWEKKFTLTDTTTPLKFKAILSKEEAEKARMSGKAIIAGAEGKGAGDIKVVSTPPKALIYLDGISTGKKTPSTLRKVPAGLDHVVLLEKEGMQPVFERLTLKDADLAEVNLTLEKSETPMTGRILVHVESEPEGAKVRINGFPLKKQTPVAVKILNSGASELEVELKDHRIWENTVRPVPGADLTFFAKLKKK